MKVGGLHIAIIGSRGYPSTYGGFETFIRVLAPFLAHRGHDVVVYGRAGHQKHRRANAGEIGVINSFGLSKTSASTLSHGLSASVDCAIRRPDVALVVNVANGFFLPALRLARVPTVLNVDGIEWGRGKWNRLGKRLFFEGARLSARWADQLVADSQGIAAIWEHTFDRRPTFIPYGAPVVDSRNPDAVRALGVEPGKYALLVARLVPENNVELALDAIELAGARAVIVGSTPDRNALESRLHRARDRGQLVWLGHVSDQELLNELWCNAAVYIHGHSVGGTNPALLQALGCGAPTVAFDSVFNREVLGNDAHLFSSDVEALAELINSIMSSSALQARLRAVGRNRVADAYRWTDVCEAYASLLERCAR